jgi:hypothetical protein
MGSTSQSEHPVPAGFFGTIRKPYDITAVHKAFSKAVDAIDDAENGASGGISFQVGSFRGMPSKKPAD